MTPFEQAALPWRLRADEETLRVMIERLRPMLRTAVGTDGPFRMGDAICTTATRPESQEIQMRATWSDGDPDRPSVIEGFVSIMPDCLEALGFDATIREGPRVAAAMLAVVERLIAAPRERADDDAPDVPDEASVAFAGIRLRTRMGTPMMEQEDIIALPATPLGTGGIRVLRTAAFLDEPGTLIDGSPWCCAPGAITVVHADRNDFSMVRRSVHIGCAVRIVNPQPIDPITMLRMEAEHPWDPSNVRHERGRRP